MTLKMRNSWGCRGTVQTDPEVGICVSPFKTTGKLAAPKSWGSGDPQAWGPTAWIRNDIGNIQVQATKDKYTFLDCVKNHGNGLCVLDNPKVEKAVFQ